MLLRHFFSSVIWAFAWVACLIFASWQLQEEEPQPRVNERSQHDVEMVKIQTEEAHKAIGDQKSALGNEG